jgi:hypothetical protein
MLNFQINFVCFLQFLVLIFDLLHLNYMKSLKNSEKPLEFY